MTKIGLPQKSFIKTVLVDAVGKTSDEKFYAFAKRFKIWDFFMKLVCGGVSPVFGLETERDYELSKPAGKEYLEKLKDEIFAMECKVCKKPTHISIDFYREIGMQCNITKRFSCLEHLNKIIENGIEDGAEEWNVWAHQENYFISDAVQIGQIKYNEYPNMKPLLDKPKLIDMY